MNSTSAVSRADHAGNRDEGIFPKTFLRAYGGAEHFSKDAFVVLTLVISNACHGQNVRHFW